MKVHKKTNIVRDGYSCGILTSRFLVAACGVAISLPDTNDRLTDEIKKVTCLHCLNKMMRESAAHE